MAEAENTETQIYSKADSQLDKFFYYNTLSGLVKNLEGQYTTVDLRNESCVTGKIIRVDGKMNMEMRDAIFFDSRGRQRVFPCFFLCNRNIRYVHIPKGKSSLELIEEQLSKMRPPVELKKNRTFKISRAERYQKETLQSAFASQST